MEFKKGKYYRCLNSGFGVRLCYGHSTLFEVGQIYFCPIDGWLINRFGSKTMMKPSLPSSTFIIHK